MSPTRRPSVSAHQSLRWRLPLVVCGLILVVLATFLWAAHVRVEATLIRAAGERAQVAADQVARLLDGERSLQQLNELGAQPALRRFLETRTHADREAARKRLDDLLGSGPRRVELWDANGTRLLELSTDGARDSHSAKVLPPGAPPRVGGIQPLQRSGNVVFSDTVAVVLDGTTAHPLGYVLIRATFTESPPGIFGRLVGRDASVRVGNRRGDVWTDLSQAVVAAKLDLDRPGIAQFRADTGEMRLAAVAHVNGAPWAVSVDFPLAAIVAPAERFLIQMSGIAVLFLAFAALGAGVVSAQITRPLSELSSAADAIADGDYSRRVEARRNDEIGRLGRAFNAMAHQVEEATHRLGARVAERTARLEALNRELEAFSYSVSHDLRAPLRSIDGFSQALMEDAADALDLKAKGHLERVRAAAQRMGELIDDLLALSRVGRADISRGVVSLSDIARDVVSELRKRAPERVVEIDIRPGIVANADGRLVRIALENLLENAWKFTGNVAAPRVEFGTEDTGRGPAHFVRDNGAGFDMRYVDKLFRPFQRLHGNAEFSGTGIGLATVHRVVDRHGGQVWAEAAVGAGTTVYFTLPDRNVHERAA